jgi:D-alanyl-D-alanine carboxypeptidase
MMNREAKRLGMKSTVFCNPSGWKNSQQLTTANDMAKLARALINEYPAYYYLFSRKEFHFGDKCIKGHYALLGKKGEIVVDGIKTGFVNASGYNLAASAVMGKRRLIAVVMGEKTSKSRDDLTYFLLQNEFLKSKNGLPEKDSSKKNSPCFTRSPKIESLLNEVLKPKTSAGPFPGIYNRINELTLSEVNKK